MVFSVLPGAVVALIDVSEWNEYNIVLYESDAGNVVVCNDLDLLQVLKVDQSAPGEIQASLNATTGNIAVATQHGLVVYEAIENYGHLPRWELAFQATDVQARKLSWIDSDRLVAVSDTYECLIWSFKELRTLWSEQLPAPASESTLFVDGVPGSGLFVTSDTSPLVKLWNVNHGSEKGVLAPDFVYLPHGAGVSKCWFVSTHVLATVASHSLFLWNTSTARLVASVPLPHAIKFPLVFTQKNAILVRGQTAHKVWKLKVDSGEGQNERQSIALSQDIVLSFDLSHMSDLRATSRRIYSLLPQKKSIDIYEIRLPTTGLIGSLSGADRDGGLRLSSFGSMVLAGKSTFSDGQRSESIDVDGSILRSALISETKALLATETLSLVSFEAAQSWKIQLEEVPLVISSYETLAILVFPSRVSLYDLDNGTKLHDTSILVTAAAAVVGNFNVVVYNDHCLTLLRVSPSSSELLKLATYEIEDDDLELRDLSLAQDTLMAVMDKDDGNAALRTWRIADGNIHELGTVDTNQALTVVATAWSQDGFLFAILTPSDIIIYAQSHSRGLTKIGALNTPKLHFTSIAWTGDLQVVLFNGVQVVYRDPQLDKLGLSVMADLGHHFNDREQPTLGDLQKLLNADLPIYHPATLLECLKALRPEIVYCVFNRLWKEIRFADTSAEGVSLLDPVLGLSMAELLEAKVESLWPGDELSELLARSRLLQVSSQDSAVLLKLVVAIGDCTKVRQLDKFALAALGLQLGGDMHRSSALVYAYFSSTKPELLIQLSPPESIAPGFWLDHDVLAEVTEQRAKADFARDREPTAVTLPYVALRKKDLLLTLWRISSGHPEREKTLKILSNDFAQERWRVAALKNAYALLSKHRPAYAAAFFLLGGSVVDCCQILVSKLKELEQAVIIARLYEGDSGKGMRFLFERYLSNDVWLRLWGNWLVNPDKSAVLNQLLESLESDPSLMFIFAEKGGQFDNRKPEWRDLLRRRGYLGIVCEALVEPLESKELPATTAASNRSRDINNDDGAGPATSGTSGSPPKEETDYENRPLPTNLKPAPESLQLEPDMSAFGF